MENRVSVTTPEHVKLDFHTAGIGSRAVSLLIDWLILGVVNGTLLVFAILFSLYSTGVGTPFWSSVTIGIFLFQFFFLPLCYYTLTEYFLNGQTLGKKAMGLTVVTDRGTAPGFLAIVLRNLLRIVDTLPLLYLTGVLTVFINGKEKRLGDLAAGTMVVHRDPGRIPRIQPLYRHEAPVFTSGELIGMKDAEWALLGHFLAGREEMFPEARREIARKLALSFLPEGKAEEGREEFYLEAAYLQRNERGAPASHGRQTEAGEVFHGV
ncbi:putative RDD family membrane protein YckC [Melghirimyces profundicolus]|uniref:Putative RDD family membrane protein YckC n=1 Tax=Melghirimyces profundicolus TaxID=1242148 RepID=A0A2T6BGA7_9BACL|nr:RDD family protein [Melghirimyces profundicolus]PTX55094.1 putative RDD family membrane protein YckC [Melghirimyces profundicolus]